MEPIAEVALIANLFDRSNVSGLEFFNKRDHSYEKQASVMLGRG